MVPCREVRANPDATLDIIGTIDFWWFNELPGRLAFRLAVAIEASEFESGEWKHPELHLVDPDGATQRIAAVVVEIGPKSEAGARWTKYLSIPVDITTGVAGEFVLQMRAGETVLASTSMTVVKRSPVPA